MKVPPGRVERAGGEVKDAAKAYATLKDTEKRAAYDRLGSHSAGEEFKPSR